MPVEREDATEAARIEEKTARAELLATHGVAAAADRDRLSLGSSSGERGANRFEGVDLDDVSDSRFVQPRVHVIDGAKIHRSQIRKGRTRGKPGAPPIPSGFSPVVSAR